MHSFDQILQEKYSHNGLAVYLSNVLKITLFLCLGFTILKFLFDELQLWCFGKKKLLYSLNNIIYDSSFTVTFMK